MFCSLFMQLSGRKMPQLYFFQDEWGGGGGWKKVSQKCSPPTLFKEFIKGGKKRGGVRRETVRETSKQL